MIHIAAIALVVLAAIWIFEALAEILVFSVFVWFILSGLPQLFVYYLGH